MKPRPIALVDTKIRSRILAWTPCPSLLHGGCWVIATWDNVAQCWRDGEWPVEPTHWLPLPMPLLEGLARSLAGLPPLEGMR